MARLRFHLDENVDVAVARALRLRGVDVTTSVEAEMLSVEDSAQFAFAASCGRVLVTHDTDFLRQVWKVTPHAGIAFCPFGTRSVGHMVRMLALMAEVISAEEMSSRVEFI